VRAQNLPVSGPLLREKAREFGKLLKHDQFQCSSGWLDRFKMRYKIVFRDVSGEAAAVDSDLCDVWTTTKRLPDLLSANAPRDMCLTLTRLACCLTKLCVLRATGATVESRAKSGSLPFCAQTWMAQRNYCCK